MSLKTVSVRPGGGGGTGTVTQVNTGTGLTGGPITTTGTVALANTAVTAGTYGNSTYVSQITVDAQGRITSASNVAITGAAASSIAVGSTAVTGGTNGYMLTINAGVLGAQAITGGGTVTSVDVSGGTTGLTTSGGPITGSGTITLAGTLGIANGGTGLTSVGVNGTVLTSNGTTASWAAPAYTGTVTSVAQSFTGGIISVSGSPVTTSGTLALTVAGTSGGIPYFSSASTWASSPTAMTLNGVIYGGGAGGSPASTAAGSTNQVLLGNTSAAPSWGALPIAAISATGTPSSANFLRGDGTWSATPAASLTVGSTATSGGAAGQIMFDTGTVLQESSNFTWDNTNNSLKIVGATKTGVTLTGVSITGTAGQFSCSAASVPLVVGQLVTISGTFGGTGSITGYSNPTNYYISATNGSTTFTLVNVTNSAIVTTAGTPTGLTYSYDPYPVLNLTQTWNSSTTAFSGLKLNVTDTASATTSLLVDFQVGGASKLSINKSGFLGIGTGSPATMLDVYGNGTVNRVAFFNGASSITPNLMVSTSGGKALALLAGSSGTAFTFDSSGVFSIASDTKANITGGSTNGGSNILTASPASSAISIAGTYSLAFTSGSASGTGLDTYLTRKAAAVLQHGLADAAAPVAQTIGVQSVVAGTTNTAGANFTINGSIGTGTGVGGSIIFQTAPAGTSGTAQNALVPALTIAGSGASTFGSSVSAPLNINPNVAVSVTTNAGTVPVTSKTNTFTNSSAAAMSITMATSGAVDGQMSIVRIYDFSAVAQTITWTNTENSTVSVPTTSNGSTTLPLTVGFMYNAATSKWRCIASA